MIYIFYYKAVNLDGNKIKGYLDVKSKKEVILNLREQGYFLTNCISCRNKIFTSTSLKKLSFICNSLSLMLSSGMNICESLNITASQVYSKYLKNNIYLISKNVEQGESLFRSMKIYPKIYPEFMLQMINVGEQSGKLEEILLNLSEYYQKMNRINSKTKNSLIYPLIIFIISIIIVTFFVVKIIPNFINILNSFNGNIPFITRVLLNISSFLSENFMYINIALLVLTISICCLVRSKKWERIYSLLKLKLPLINRLYEKIVLYKFCITMSILDSSGVNVLKSLEIAANTVGNTIFKERIFEVMKDIKNGYSIYFSLKRNKVGNEGMLGLIKVGEEAGMLDEMFDKTAYILQIEIEDNFKFAVSIIEPVSILILSIFVGMFVVAALLPILNIMDCV